MRIYEEVQEEEEEEEERPWEEVIKKRRWKMIRSPHYYSTKFEVKKAEKKKWRLASVITYQSNTSCLQSFFFNGSLFSSIEKPKEKKKERWGWESLPSTALLNIFCNTELKDRLKSIPLVCKSWKYVTDDPRCWSSMIPDSVSPEDAFIRNSTSGYVLESYTPKSCIMKLVKKKDNDFLIGISRLFKEEGDHHDPVQEEIYDDDDDEEIYYEEEEVSVGLTRLQTLIKKSGGGAAITTLYLDPFIQYGLRRRDHIDETYDEILHLIANCCPNLKHISLDTLFSMGTTEACLQLINRCKKLELVELKFFRFNKHGESTLIIQEIGNCLPNLRGIRIESLEYHPTTILSIATCLPQLKLLSLSYNRLNGEHLSAILFSCLELQYLYVKGPRQQLWYNNIDIVGQASAQIPEFYIEDYYSHWFDRRVWSFGRYSRWPESMKGIHKCKKTDVDDDYRYVLKQRKEGQYVSILKEKKEYHYILKKKERDQCNSRWQKKKNKCKYDSTVRKKKKIDQCDYADYVIR